MQFKTRQVFDGNSIGEGRTIHITGTRIQDVEREEGRANVDFVMPGFIDSHVHLLSVGLSLLALRLNDCRSREDFVGELKSYAARHPGQWITGRGWDQTILGFTPDRHFLDEICPERPVILNRTCGHVVAVNSKALELSGVTGNTPDIPGGVIKRDSAGEPTGILEEKAAALIADKIPVPEAAILYGALEKGIKYAHSCGITGVQTDDRGTVGEYLRLWELYTKVTEALPIRAQLHYSINSPETLREYIRVKGELVNTRFIHTGAAKIFLDGSLGAGTAALLDSYSDDSGNKGVLIYPESVVRQIMVLAEENGIQLAMHAIGDAAMEQAIRILADVRGGYKKGNTMHRIVHCQVTNRSQIERMVALGLAAEIQPVFLQTDMHWAESRLGKSRLQTSYCWRTMDEAGVFLSGGSDSPVEDINPWPGIYAAVTRKDRKGNYAEAWSLDESLTLPRALEIYTAAGAELAGWNTGCLAPGMAADLAVYSRFNQNLAGNKPDQVLVDGITVFKR